MKARFLSVLVASALLSISSLHAQSIAELNRQVDSLIQVSAFDKALPLAQKAMKKAGKELNRLDSIYGNALNNLTGVYLARDQVSQADTLWQNQLAFIGDSLGVQHPLYGTALYEIGQIAYIAADYNKSDSLLLVAQKLLLKTKDSKTIEQALIQKILGNIRHQRGQFKESMELLKQAVDIVEPQKQRYKYEYISILTSLGATYNELGMFEDELAVYNRSAAFSEQETGTNNLSYATTLHNLAGLHEEMGHYQQADSLYQVTLQLKEKLTGKQTMSYALTLNNWAYLKKEIGFYQDAVELFTEASQIAAQISGMKQSFYVIALGNIGSVYVNLGYYQKAEENYLLSLNLKAEVLGKQHPSYGRTLNNLANLYYLIGQVERAELLAKEVLKIDELSVGKEHAHYATSLMNLGTYLSQQKKFSQADALYKEAITILQKNPGNQHPDFAFALTELGKLQVRQKKIDLATKSFTESLAILDRTVGHQHANYIETLAELINTYEHTNEFDKSEKLYRQLIPFYSTGRFSWETSFYVQSLLANIAERMHYLNQADSLYTSLYNKYVLFNQQFSQFLPEAEHLKSQQRLAKLVAQVSSFYNRHSGLFPDSPDLVANDALYRKGKQLQNNLLLRQHILSSKDTSLLALLSKWEKQKQLLYFYLQNPNQTKYINLYDEEVRAEQLEKQLLQRSQAFRQANELNNVRWQDVQKQLKPDEAAVEFIHFPYYNGIDETDTVRYMALVVRPADRHPQLVRLFEERQLDSLLHWAGTQSERIKQLYSPASSQGKKLYQLIWKPLAPLLNATSVVYVSPSGLLNRVSFGAIFGPDGRFLADRYEIRQRMSLRQLATPPADTRLAKNSRAVVYGGIQYETDSLALRQVIAQKNNPAISYRRSIDSTRGGSWGALPATLTEAQTISKLLKTNGIRSELRTGLQANEESVKALGIGQSPEVIHLATHGFFYPEPLQSDKNVFKSAENPLLRSGLILAGANRVWRGGKPITGLEDGILTAYEVANLNLSSTKLVTLSACETGLGDIRGAEGVYGLQRAFRLAGVPLLLVSLWRVPDKETARFMTLFYGEFTKGMPVEVAFQQAQHTIRQNLSPYYWGAFVLIR